tara:strand:- start:6177 stop:6377 length:201 start_codon:yes stop_codon:yes gene_type:complete
MVLSCLINWRKACSNELGSLGIVIVAENLSSENVKIDILFCVDGVEIGGEVEQLIKNSIISAYNNL